MQELPIQDSPTDTAGTSSTPPSQSSMNATLHERLIRAEQQFLLAVVSNDEESLKVFSQEWSQLAQDIASVAVAGHLDDDTALLLSQVSRAVENTANCMLESGAILQETQTRSISEFIQDRPSDPSSITLPHPHAIAPYHILFPNLPSSKTPSILGQQKLLDPFAYRWLLQNIHNPYPSSVQTRIMGDVSGTSTVQVELWFQEIRDSIGWSKLSLDLFAGSVNATVAAARRVYLERDRDISFDIVFAFVAVKASAETLFPEYPALRGKNTKTAAAQSISTAVRDQYHHLGSFPNQYIIEPEGVIVPPQVDPPAPLDPFSDLSDSDESEEEDTTPPPPIAGCKRPLTEDVLTSQAFDIGKPQKRRRTTSIALTPYSEAESPAPSPFKLGLSSEQTMPTRSASLVSRFLSLHSSLIPPESSPGLPPVSQVSQEGTCVGLEEATPEGAEGLLHTHILAHGVRKRKLSQCVSPMPSKRQCLPSIPTRRHCTVHPTPSFDGYPDLCPFQGGSTGPEVPQSTLQISVNPDASVNFGVFDWNSIPDPLVETATSLSQPAVVYVPSSDLTSQLVEPPDFGPDLETSHSLVDLGSLRNLGSSLQFPTPTPPGQTPDLSTSFATSPHPWSSPFPLQDFDLSSITEFIDSFTPDSTQSLTSSGVSPLPPESSQESLYRSQSFNSTKQPSSVLDPSVPPSIFLPFESGLFSENMDDMWSFIRDGS